MGTKEKFRSGIKEVSPILGILKNSPARLDVLGKEVARAAGISKSYLSNIANGVYPNVSTKVYYNLCHATGIDPSTSELINIENYVPDDKSQAQSEEIRESRSNKRLLNSQYGVYTVNSLTLKKRSVA